MNYFQAICLKYDPLVLSEEPSSALQNIQHYPSCMRYEEMIAQTQLVEVAAQFNEDKSF